MMALRYGWLMTLVMTHWVPHWGSGPLRGHQSTLRKSVQNLVKCSQVCNYDLGTEEMFFMLTLKSKLSWICGKHNVKYCSVPRT